MNEITRVLVLKVAREHKAVAKRNDSDFRWLVDIAHWDYLIGLYGVDIRERAQELMRAFRPELFDSDGFISQKADRDFDLDYHLSNIAVRVLQCRIDRDPALRLTYDWGDLPKLTAEPQLRLF